MQPEKHIKESLPEPGDIMGRAMPGENGGAMSNKMPKERLTEDLLARLLNSKTPEDYLSRGGSSTANCRITCSPCWTSRA